MVHTNGCIIWRGEGWEGFGWGEGGDTSSFFEISVRPLFANALESNL